MPQSKTRTRAGRRWSSRVTRESDALDLHRRVFTWRDPKRIARSLKQSAEHSKRRKSVTFSIRDVDAELLHQSRRSQPSGGASTASSHARGTSCVGYTTDNERNRGHKNEA